MTAATRQQMMDALASRFVPHHAPDLSGVFQFDIGEGAALQFHVVVSQGSPRFGEGPHPSPSLRLALAPEDYWEIFRGDLTQLFAQGRLTAEGDLRLGLTLAAMLMPQAAEQEWHPDRAALEVASTASPPLTEVERRAVPPLEEFEARYARASRPVIFTDALREWDREALALQSLAERFGGLQVVPRVGDYVSSAFTAERKYAPMPLREYLALLARPPEDGHPPPYLGNSPVPDALSPFLRPPPFFPERTLGRPSLWLGPAGTVTPLHRDLVDNALAQVSGSKRLRLYPPEQARLLYVWESTEVLDGSRFDPERPDYEAHPLAREARGVECTLGAGELLFIPAGWFHHVRSLSTSLSVNFFQFFQAPAAQRRPAG